MRSERDKFEEYLKREGLFNDLSKELCENNTKYYYPVLNDAFSLWLAAQKDHQERINKALSIIYKEKSAVECGKYNGADADLIIGIGYELYEVLTGEKK